MKKVTHLEDAIRYEKQKEQAVTAKLTKAETFNKTLLTKITSLEKTVKSKQQRIFELEGEIMVTSTRALTLLAASWGREVVVGAARGAR